MNNIRLSSILLPIGAISAVVLLLEIFNFIPNASETVAIIAVFGLIGFPVGLILWFFESKISSTPEASDKVKGVRKVSLVILLCFILVMAYMYYALSNAWN